MRQFECWVINDVVIMDNNTPLRKYKEWGWEKIDVGVRASHPLITCLLCYAFPFCSSSVLCRTLYYCVEATLCLYKINFLLLRYVFFFLPKERATFLAFVRNTRACFVTW